MLDILYSIIIYPLYQIVEFFYSLCDAVVKNPGYAVVGVSLAVSFLCLPMYIIAERWQEVERNTQKQLKPGVDRIKAVFKGDEQYMMLSTYYKQHHYHPAMALRSSLSLLIQIPFFIAAYKFLSNLEILKGYSFFFIRDMGAPDAMFSIGNFDVNVLPIAMTIINIVAGVIYSKGHPFKEKLQIYLLAIFFLVFLYNSPSGLVLYWTLNNVFSLIKNIFYKLKHPLFVLYICLVVAVLGTDYFLLFKHGGFLYRRLTLVAVITILLFIPLIVKGINWILKNPLKKFVEADKKRTICFILSCVAMAILVGYAIPSFMISSSPAEFSFIDEYDSPFYFLRNTLWQSIGFCIFWPCCMYFLFGRRIKSLIAIFMATVSLCGVVNAFAFSGNYGLITTNLTFTDPIALKPSVTLLLINLAALAVIFALIYIIFYMNKIQFVSYTSAILSFTLIVMSVVNSSKISKGYKVVAELKENDQGKKNDLSPIFNLSKTEKNVIVVMEDRAINGLMPYLLEERPELYQQYEGFVYYPNTVSFGTNTLSGSPSLYGGYEYTPEALNRDDKRPLVDKHNEALKVLPVLFDKEGFVSTVTDMSWANYSWITDFSIYDDYPSIRRAPSKGLYNQIWQEKHKNIVLLTPQSVSLKRNLLWFSFFKIMPTLLRETIYEDGHWWAIKESTEDVKDFLNSYAVLDFLPELTACDSEKPTFTVFVNEATHEPVLTGYPNYDLTTDDIGPYPLDDDIAYNAFASALLRFGEYLDYLKEEGVYDNTRIIFVADHGGPSKLSTVEPDYPYNNYRPILLVKDFDATGDLKFDNTFMTNADTSILATDNLIENATNPFTGKLLKDSVKKDPVYACSINGWAPDRQGKNTLNINQWYSVRDDIFNLDNWKEESPFDNNGEDK